MSREVTIVDMGLGNLRSVARAFERAGASTRISADAQEIARASCVVVPGQGAFRDCALALSRGLGEAVRESIARGIPYFGICLGMQMLFDSSEEAPGAQGLSVYSGEVVRFATGELKVPHMGWNDVRTSHPYMRDGAYYYFVHSYHCVPNDSALVAATVDYGGTVCAAIAKDNVFACQFHPEKSQDEGAHVIERFLAGAAWS